MSEAGRRRWWRGVAAAVVGGGAVAGAWFGVIRQAGAEPIPQTFQAGAAWAAAPQASPQTPADPNVVPAGVPTISPVPQPIVPVAVNPVVPAAAPGVSPAGGLPALPTAELPPLPTPLADSPVKPIAPLDGPEAAPPQVPPMMGMGGILPVRPPEPRTDKPTAEPKKDKPTAEPKKDKPAAATPPALPPIPTAGPTVPPPAEIAPPPSPTRLPEPPRPAVPPVSDLPGGNAGASVKSDNVGRGTGVVPPVLPAVPPPLELGGSAKPQVPAIPAAGGTGNTAATPADIAKPPTIPLPRDFAPIPSPSTNTTAPTSGENTMLHLNKAAALAVIGGALMAPASPASAAPVVRAPAVPTAQTGGKDEKTEVAELKKKVDEVNDKLGTIQKDLRTLTELLNGRKDEKGYPLASDPGVVAQMKEFKDKITRLQEDLDRLKTQTSLRPAVPAATPDAKAGKGTIRVVNEYPVRISIVVNGTSYRVEPTKTLDIDVPAGDFTYQLLESGAASTKSAIKEKETVTLRIK